MEWNNDIAIFLIEEYRKLEILWDTRHPEYYSKTRKNDAWESLIHKINLPELTVEEAQKKIKSLLGSFRREKSKIRKSEGTGKGANDIYKSKWFAFDCMQFLMDRDEPRRGLNTENEETEPDVHEVSHESEQRQLEDEPEDMGNSVSFAQSFSTQTSSVSQPILVKQGKRQKQQSEDPRIQKAFEIMESASKRKISENIYTSYGQHIAQKIIGYSVRTRALVEHEINNVLFKADMGYYDGPGNSVTQMSPNPSSTVTTFPGYPAATVTNIRPSPHFTSAVSSTPTLSAHSINLSISTPAPSPLSDQASIASTAASYYDNPSPIDSAISQYFTQFREENSERD